MSAKPVNKSRVSSRKSGGSQSNSIGLWIVGVSVAVVVLVVALMMISSRQNVIAVETPDVQPEWIDRTTMGNPDASVVVQAWEDFLCPSCMQWTQMIEPVCGRLREPGLCVSSSANSRCKATRRGRSTQR